MTLPLPDLTHFTHILVSPPVSPRGTGWDKLKECERRLTLYRWAEHLNAPPEPTSYLPLPPHQVFLDDCLSAFLLTFEAALQFVARLFRRLSVSPSFNQWLKGLPEHDLYVRGLRTLRHIAAHVEIKPAERGGYVLLGKIGEPSTASHKWLLPELD
jgi:hypothetical protein